MEIAGIDEQQIAKMVADQLAATLEPVVKKSVEQYERPDEVLDAKGICKKVLHCSTTILTEYYLYQPGFPSFRKKSQRVYSRKAVEKWIATHQEYV